MNQYLVIRIAGQVDLTRTEKEALYRLRMRRKYAATILPASEPNIKLLQQLRNLISYGEINDETLLQLVEKRGQLKDKKKKLDAAKVMEKVKKESFTDLDIKPFFRLHPPRGGIDAKKHAGVDKGVLGYNKKLNELVRRML